MPVKHIPRVLFVALVTLAAIGFAGVPVSASTRAALPTSRAIAAAQAPAARGYHLMAYDRQSDRVILTGGVPDPSVEYHDTWAYHPATRTWHAMHPAPDPTGPGPMVYATRADRIILYIGAELDPTRTPIPIAPRNETWAYNIDADAWTKLPSVGTPVGLLGAAMAYDRESDRIILFGGADLTKEELPALNDTWAYDVKTNTWSKMAPKRRPPARAWSGMVYHTAADRVLLWGGVNPEETQDRRIWAYDFNTDSWENLGSQGAPAALGYTAMVYEPVSQRVILFGGVTSAERPTNRTWAYTYATKRWKNLKAATPPSARAWHSMTYITTVKQIILFGGGPNRTAFTAETWLYNPRTNRWTQVTTPS